MTDMTNTQPGLTCTIDPDVVIPVRARQSAAMKQLVTGAGMDTDEAQITLAGLTAGFGTPGYGRAVSRLYRAGLISSHAQAAYGRAHKARAEAMAISAGTMLPCGCKRYTGRRSDEGGVGAKGVAWELCNACEQREESMYANFGPVWDHGKKF